MLKVAIIGLGTVSPVHKQAIEDSEFAKLVAVCDIDKDKKSMAEDVNFYTDIEEMLDSEELDCVHICLPHFLHLSTIVKCAKKGINVFTEKPLTLNYEEATQLFDLEETYHIKIGVCLQNRYNATSIKLKSLMHNKDYGKFLGSKGIVTWCRTMDYYNTAPWRGKIKLAGSGVLMNQTIHTLDLLSYIGGDFDKINAKVTNFTLPLTEIEDTVVAHLKYKDSEATGIYFATIGHCTNSNVEIEMVFEKVSFKIFDNKLYKYDTTTSEQEFICEDKKLDGSKHYYGASHFFAINSFYAAIVNKTNDYVNVRQAAVSLKLIETIMESSQDNTEKTVY